MNENCRRAALLDQENSSNTEYRHMSAMNVVHNIVTKETILNGISENTTKIWGKIFRFKKNVKF